MQTVDTFMVMSLLQATVHLLFYSVYLNKNNTVRTKTSSPYCTCCSCIRLNALCLSWNGLCDVSVITWCVCCCLLACVMCVDVEMSRRKQSDDPPVEEMLNMGGFHQALFFTTVPTELNTTNSICVHWVFYGRQLNLLVWNVTEETPRKTAPPGGTFSFNLEIYLAYALVRNDSVWKLSAWIISILYEE